MVKIYWVQMPRIYIDIHIEYWGQPGLYEKLGQTYIFQQHHSSAISTLVFLYSSQSQKGPPLQGCHGTAMLQIFHHGHNFSCSLLSTA